MGIGSGSRSHRRITEINITPFVDVVLVLLVIFMVTAPMIAKQALEVRLPSAKSADTVDPKTFGISITSVGRILVNGEVMAEETLQDQLREEAALFPKIQVILSVDKEAQYKFIVKAMDIVKLSGVTNFAFQVNREETTTESIEE